MVSSCPSDDEVRRKGLGNLVVLHDHLVSYITFLLDLEDVVRLSCCSRILRVFACEEPLWLGLCLKHQDGLVEFKANWRQTALLSYTAKLVPPEAIEAAARPLPPLQDLNSLFLYKRWYRGHVDLRGFLPPADAATVERSNATAMTAAEFVDRYDRPSLPVLLGGLQDAWPAASWSLPELSAAFPTARFLVSKPHGGRAIMNMPAYVDYMARQADEEPMYIFDPTFVEAAPGIRKLYDIPHVFAQDYFSHLKGLRPPYRWLVLGPARAGANWHVDPTLTSAWNALLSGRKRWALYPPHVRPPGIILEDDGEDTGPSEDSLTSLQWFLEVYPSLPPERRPIEFVQNPGDVVFVPGGWWHCVLNLETAVAVTQNYVGSANLERVVRYMACGSAHYHADPLDYYDPGTEVAAWKARYPDQFPEVASEEENSARSMQQKQKQKQEEEAGDGKGKAAGGKRVAEGVEGAALADEGTEIDGMEMEGGAGSERAGPAKVDPVKGKPSRDPCPRVRGLWAGRFPAPGMVAPPYDCRTNGGDDAELLYGNCSAAGADEGRAGAGGSGAAAASEVPTLAWRGALAYEEVAVWRRNRPLGRWLRRLWEQEPQARATIQGCLANYLHEDFWREALRTIAAQHSGPDGGRDAGAPLLPPEPSSLELMPLMGADALVFLYGSLAVKIFDHEVPALRGLMCALEAFVPRLLLPAAASASASAGTGAHVPQLPQPLARGALAVRLTLSGPAAEEEQEGCQGMGEEERATATGTAGQEEQEILYLIQQQIQATVELYDLLDREPPPNPHHLAAVAEALGHLVGAMHATSATAAPAAAAAAPTAAAVAALATRAGSRARDGAGAAADGGGSGGGSNADAGDGVQRGVDWNVLVRTRAVWHDRDGFIWVSGLGCLNRPADGGEGDGEEDAAGGKQACGTRPPEVASGAGSAGSAAAADEAQAGGGGNSSGGRGGGATERSCWPCDVPQGSLWWPFVQHLRRRQQVLLRGLPTNTELPVWVREQLPAYLPADPALLLGFCPPPPPPSSEPSTLPTTAPTRPEPVKPAELLPPVAMATEVSLASPPGDVDGSVESPSDPGVPPLLLHGDVTSHNVVLEDLPYDGSGAGPGAGPGAEDVVSGTGGVVGDQPWQPKLCLVDFSDAGHGDPLYDLLAVLGSCMTFDVAAMRHFWTAYRRHVDPARVWPQRWRCGVALSYSALCYCLLHEEAELMLNRLWSDRGRTGASTCGQGGGGSSAAGTRGDQCKDVAVEDVGDGAVAGVECALAGSQRGRRTLQALATELWGFLDEV